MKTFNIGDLLPNTPHLFSDLVELLLLIKYRGRTFIHINELEDFINFGVIGCEEIDHYNSADDSDDDGSAERSRIIEDVSFQLDYRSKTFLNSYPFTFDKNKLEFGGSLSNEQNVYRFLLACSRLRSFGRNGIPQKWAKGFAIISKLAMRGLVPDYADTRIFDANSEDRHTYYGTNLQDAIKTLGRDLSVLNINDDECNRISSSGDAGIDIVASYNFDDGAASSLAILGQCGAREKEWPKKTLEATPVRLRHFYQMQLDHLSTMFTPVCFRRPNGEWVDNGATNGVLLLDRLRIIKLLNLKDFIPQVVSETWFKEFQQEFSEYGLSD